MKICRTITIILTTIAILICCGFINMLGGMAFISIDYNECGYPLIIGSIFLIGAYIFGLCKKVVPVIILNIIGSAGYIYTLAYLNAIPNSSVPRIDIEKLMTNHMFSIAVTVLLALMAFFNYFHDTNVKKREAKAAAKKEARERKLTESETIL